MILTPNRGFGGQNGKNGSWPMFSGHRRRRFSLSMIRGRRKNSLNLGAGHGKAERKKGVKFYFFNPGSKMNFLDLFGIDKDIIWRHLG